MTEYYVNYTVTMSGTDIREMVTGPYRSYDEAEEDRWDIKGYSRVSKSYVTTALDTNRTLINRGPL